MAISIKLLFWQSLERCIIGNRLRGDILAINRKSQFQLSVERCHFSNQYKVVNLAISRKLSFRQSVQICHFCPRTTSFFWRPADSQIICRTIQGRFPLLRLFTHCFHIMFLSGMISAILLGFFFGFSSWVVYLGMIFAILPFYVLSSYSH